MAWFTYLPGVQCIGGFHATEAVCAHPPAWHGIAVVGGRDRAAGVIGQTPWIDAGQQAMTMHQGDLLEQQTAPNNGDREDNRASSKQKPDAASLACSTARDREKLRPEYERRVRTDGRQAADTWLRQEAAALGRQAGARAKVGERC